MDQFTVGSAGTLVAASLQSAGLFFQSQILDAFYGPFEALPVLLFVIASLLALGSTVMFGRPRESLSLLVGPIILVTLLAGRVEVSDTQWRLGNSQGDPQQVRDLTETITGEAKAQPRVSSFFAHFDRVTSDLVQTLAGQLSSARADANLSVVAKTQLYGYLMSQTISDPGLRELLHLSLLGQCRGMVEAGAEMADKRNKRHDRCEWAKAYRERFDSTRFSLTPQARNYLARLYTDVPTLEGVQVVSPPDQELFRVRDELQGEGVACDVFANPGTGWTLQDPADVARAAAAQTAALRSRIRAGAGSRLSTSTDIARIAREMEEREELIAKRETQLDGEIFHCDQVWNIAFVALHYEAALTVEAAKEQAREQGIDPDVLLEQVAWLTGATEQQEILRAMARRMFRLEAVTSPSSAFIAEYANRGMSLTRIGDNSGQDFIAELRKREREQEWRDQGEIMSLAQSFPYYQGIVLYALTVTYPFFALLLAIPGYRNGFFMWCALWIWAKSWDIGYACVTWIDEILRTLFFVRFDNGYLREVPVLDLDFSAAVASLRDIDPTFNIALYYNIMGSCLMAIPTLLSQVLLGGLLQAGEAATERLRDFSRESGRELDSFANTPGQDPTIIPTVYGGTLNPIVKGSAVNVTVLEQRERRIQNARSEQGSIDGYRFALPDAEESAEEQETEGDRGHNRSVVIPRIGTPG